jgi:hypothetical protein
MHFVVDKQVAVKKRSFGKADRWRGSVLRHCTQKVEMSMEEYWETNGSCM